MDGVGISIIERPRPLPGHATPNPTEHPYTLKCEEPHNLSACAFVVLFLCTEPLSAPASPTRAYHVQQREAASASCDAWEYGGV